MPPFLHLYPSPLHRKLRELAGQASAPGVGKWGSWHQAVTLVESQYKKGAFPPQPLSPHILVLASFPKESIHSMAFPFPLLSFLTHRNLQAICIKVQSKLRSPSHHVPNTPSCSLCPNGPQIKLMSIEKRNF